MTQTTASLPSHTTTTNPPYDPRANSQKPSRVEMKSSPRDFARSSDLNWKPPISPIPESRLLKDLKVGWQRSPTSSTSYEDYREQRATRIIDLHAFEIYRSPQAQHRRHELIALHLVETPKSKKACVDGYVYKGNVKHYVQGLGVQGFSIEGYGDDDEPEIVAYLRTEIANKDAHYDIWYRLREPSQAYQRFHKPFLWIAQFGKYVIDYLGAQLNASAGLERFRQHFHEWLFGHFGFSPSFQQWHRCYNERTDFRVAVHAYIGYLYNQAYNLSNADDLLSHTVWADCMTSGLTRVKTQKQIVKHTIATPAVYECFKDSYFGSHIQQLRLAPSVEIEKNRRRQKLGFADERRPAQTPSAQSPTSYPCHPYRQEPVRPGEVVAFDPDENDLLIWSKSREAWLAYVQRVELRRDGVQRLFVLYLYRASDTNMFKARYPHANELFFSNSCNCSERELLSTDVKGWHRVEWMPKSLPSTTYFIRQTYITQDSAFVTLHEDHTTCICQRPRCSPSDHLRCGDTVYMSRTVEHKKILEPVVIRSIREASAEVTIRRLGRLGRDYPQLAEEAGRNRIAANELVLTDDYETVRSARIHRSCQVRFVSENEVLEGQIPFPYDRGGAGDFWFISMGVTRTDGALNLAYLGKLPPIFREAEFVGPRKKLAGLSLFSGGGNLDRGLEEGEAVKFHTAVDFSPEAIHTQRANASNADDLRLYCGSVDDYLRLALQGKKYHLVAKIGEVAVIAAGSPCPGFSPLQQNFRSEKSLRNASHISTFCSYVDLYRPEYGVLENVVNMASTRTGFENENVLSQLVTCLVSMGYQVNQYIMDSWNYGSGQQRTRLFLTIAAPGLEPIQQPQHTHSRRYEDTPRKSLGKLPDGQNFGDREHYPTPFDFVSAGQVTSDLPNIYGGCVNTCVSHPDHRVSAPPSAADRALLKCIPLNPPGCGYKEAFESDLIPESLHRPGKENGKAFRRIIQDGSIPTITTTLSPQDSRNGANIHWSQHRPITIMEARRAQGYLDHEVIIGSQVQQYRIIGNGVDRKTSFALGLALGRAVSRNHERRSRRVIYEQEDLDEMLVDHEDNAGYSGTATQAIDDP